MLSNAWFFFFEIFLFRSQNEIGLFVQFSISKTSFFRRQRSPSVSLDYTSCQHLRSTRFYPIMATFRKSYFDCTSSGALGSGFPASVVVQLVYGRPVFRDSSGRTNSWHKSNTGIFSGASSTWEQDFWKMFITTVL